MSRRTQNHRLEVVTPNAYHSTQLSRLNRDLDNLYELVYGQWRTITEEDYHVFGGQYEVMLDSIKGLYRTCRNTPRQMGLREQTKQLWMNYTALAELNNDIVRYCVRLPKDSEIKTLLSQADNAMKTQRV